MSASAPTRSRLKRGLVKPSWLNSRWAKRTVGVVKVAGLLLGTYFLLPSKFGGDTAYVVVKGTSMQPDYVTGDIVAVRPTDRYEVGDVVVYAVPEGEVGAGKLIIHRIIDIDAEGLFVFQGDNRDEPDPIRLNADGIVGIERLHVPHVNLVTRVLLRWWVIGGIVGIFTLLALWPKTGESAEGASDDEPAQPSPPVRPAVSVVVDGDGLIASVPAHGECAVARQACVDEVDRLVRRYGGTALVVFEHADAPLDPVVDPVVEGRFATVHQGDMHAVIAELAGRPSDFADARVLLVVTDDERLAETARGFGAPVVSSTAWLGLVGV